jgi:cytochrome c553
MAVMTAALSSCGGISPPAVAEEATSGHVVALGGGGAGAGNACINCHGLKGEGDGTTVPYLAGMDQGYLHRQLNDYASGRRQHDAMSAIAKRLTPDDRASVAAYYQHLAFPLRQAKPVVPNAIYRSGDATRGLSACASCHGQQAEGIGAANPPLAQQPAQFIASQLWAWKRGERQNDPQHVMLHISQLLTHQEISEISAHVSNLPQVLQAQVQATYPPARRADPRNDASGPHQYAPE